MRIGTDVSIETCRAEGYLVMDYAVYPFKKDPINTDVRFTCSLPDYVREESGWSVGQSMLYLDMMLNYNDLWEMYTDNKDGIDSFIGDEHVWTLNPEPWEVLMLASDINSYCGIE